MDRIMQIIETQGVKLLGGILTLAAGFFLTHWLMKFLRRSRHFDKVDPMLKGFLQNLIRFVLIVLAVLTAVNEMGFPLTSFVTILASAGVAVSLALQGALSNFVGGVMMLLLKPFRAGDYVKIGDTEGTARSIGMSLSASPTAMHSASGISSRRHSRSRPEPLLTPLAEHSREEISE